MFVLDSYRCSPLYFLGKLENNHIQEVNMRKSNPVRRLFILILVAPVLFVSTTSPKPLIDQKYETRIDSLLKRMTLEEKVGQLNLYSGFFNTGPAAEQDRNKQRNELLKNGMVGALLNVVGAEATFNAQKTAVEGSRLGIPLLFGLDVIHGYKTSFPIPLAEAASFDLEAIELSARIAAKEASAVGVNWTFAPMVDIARDARWGRIMEGAGEDPYLGAQVAAARVRGFQGDDLSALDTIAACAKHYAAYGFAEGGRDYNTVDISENTLRNIVLPPFKASADAGVATFMNSFNEIGGIPATGSVHLQRDILKGEWGFGGFVVSDWGSIGEIVFHGTAADQKEAALLAIKAGSDMDMESSAYVENLAELVKSGAVDIKLIDDAVRRVLRIKFLLGLFDDPYRYSSVDREKEVLNSESHILATLDIARKSIVLLKNQDNILPLDKNRGTIAVIGALANDSDTPHGSWRGRAVSEPAVTLLEGVKAAVSSNVEVRFAEGAKLVTGDRIFAGPITFNENDRSGFGEAVEAALGADMVILALGEVAYQTGEGRSQVDIGFKGLQLDLFNEILAVNKNIVVVLMNGRPLVLKEIVDKVPAIVEAWHLGAQAGQAIADVLFGEYNPSGKLPVSFPYHVGQEPLYYNRKNTGRPVAQVGPFWSHYEDAPNTALFPFGFGLSYTTFEYSDIKLSSSEIAKGEDLDIVVNVMNTGERTGTEVVQLYIRDMVGSMTRPIKELKGFKNIELAPGESKDITFTMSDKDLAFYTAAGKWEAEPGSFEVFVGGNSVDLKKAAFTLK
jgi:beta-glucosidase